VGGAHRGHFASDARLAAEKMRILDGLRPGGWAVLDGTDGRLRAHARGRRVAAFGAPGDAYRASGVQVTTRGTRFTLHARGGRYRTHVALLGAHQAHNAVAAVAACACLGLDVERLARRLRSFRPAGRMRMEPSARRGVFFVNDAYNASPLSLRAALEAFAGLEAPARGGRKAAALGDMLELGASSGRAHQEAVAEALATGLEALVLVGEGMRGAFEGLTRIRLKTGRRVPLLRRDGAPPLLAAAFDDAPGAGGFLRAWAKKGDAVLLKGSRGMRIERVLEAFS